MEMSTMAKKFVKKTKKDIWEFVMRFPEIELQFVRFAKNIGDSIYNGVSNDNEINIRLPNKYQSKKLLASSVDVNDILYVCVENSNYHWFSE